MENREAKKILVVEDEKDTVEMITTLLVLEGYQVFSAVYLLGGEIALRVEEGEEDPVLQSIPGESAFDAFNHPYCYLPG